LVQLLLALAMSVSFLTRLLLVLPVVSVFSALLAQV
jgi:hypothetical protein